MRVLLVIVTFFTANGAFAMSYRDCLDHLSTVKVFEYDFDTFLKDEANFWVEQVRDGNASKMSVSNPIEAIVSLDKAATNPMGNYVSAVTSYCESLSE